MFERNDEHMRWRLRIDVLDDNAAIILMNVATQEQTSTPITLILNFNPDQKK